MAPFSTSSRLISAAFVRLPLWAMARVPQRVLTLHGWALASTVLPVVEYRVWPTATSPGSRLRIGSSKFSETSPMPRCARAIPSRSTATMPALSWPRCCRA